MTDSNKISSIATTILKIFILLKGILVLLIGFFLLMINDLTALFICSVVGLLLLYLSYLFRDVYVLNNGVFFVKGFFSSDKQRVSSIKNVINIFYLTIIILRKRGIILYVSRRNIKIEDFLKKQSNNADYDM